MGSKRGTPEERFWRWVDKSDGCWEWSGSRVPKGYGQLNIERKPVRANRLSWEIHYGPIPPGQWVLHRCDNPPCVRPDHLYLGTPRRNSQDAVERDRLKTPNANSAEWRSARRKKHRKLSDQDVADIRRRWAAGGCSYSSLATEYGVFYTSIKKVVLRESYKDLP